MVMIRTDGTSEIAVRIATVSKTEAVSYTHLRAHETVLDLVCRLLLEKKKKQILTHQIRGNETDIVNRNLNSDNYNTTPNPKIN